MAKSGMGAIEDSSLILLWEELEALEAIAGWDDAYDAGTKEDTVKQPQNIEHNKTCVQGVVGIDGSKSGWKEERNCTGKSESDSSQSPRMSLSKSLRVTSAVQSNGCIKNPKLASSSGSGFSFTSARRTEEDGEVVVAVNKHRGCGSDWRTFAHSTNGGGKKKLEKLKRESGKKGFDRGSLDAIAHRSQIIGDIAFCSAVHAIKIQSGANKCDSKVTAFDLLKTAMDVGIGLPPPFHQNYFK